MSHDAGNDYSVESQLIRNEQLLRTRNTKLKNGIKKYFRNDSTIVAAPVSFACECSDLSCQAHVQASVTQYEKLHKRHDRFITAKKHDIPAIEKIVESTENFDVVQKPALEA